jgi:hypothetical protein
LSLKLTITAPGISQPFLLAQSGTARIIPGAAPSSWNNGAPGPIEEGFIVKQSYKVQPVGNVRAPYKINLPRYNLEAAGQFTVSRTFGTTSACILFLATHPNMVPASGTLTLTYSGPDGGAQNLFLPAVIQGIDTSYHVGRSCKLIYRYAGSASGWTNVNPSQPA